MDMTRQNAKRALSLTTVLTLFVAGFELFTAYANYKPGMNFFDLASYVTANRYFYYLLLIIADMVMLPGAVLLFKENGLSLKDEIFEKKSLGKDILIGIIALALTGIPAILFSFIYNFQTDMGEMTAFILFNVMFAMLDWYNFGLSFIIGLIWTMIAHGGINIISLIYRMVVTR